MARLRLTVQGFRAYVGLIALKCLKFRVGFRVLALGLRVSTRALPGRRHGFMRSHCYRLLPLLPRCDGRGTQRNDTTGPGFRA